MVEIDTNLADYINKNIIPQYAHFDHAHNLDHVQTVIKTSLELTAHYQVNINMVFTIAAYHDLGIAIDRDTHHIESGKILLADNNLKKWFSEEEIGIMKEAVEDHRASSKTAPRSIYGKIVAEADRDISTHKILLRTIQFGLDKYPNESKEFHYQRFIQHLNEKYAEGGYLKLWIPYSDNAANLKELQMLIKDKNRLRQAFEKIFTEIHP